MEKSYTQEQLNKLTNNDLLKIVNESAEKCEALREIMLNLLTVLEEQTKINDEAKAKLLNNSDESETNLTHIINTSEDKCNKLKEDLKILVKEFEDMEKIYADALLTLDSRLNPVQE